MDERIEHSGDTAATTRSAIGRREMLQRTGFVVGAAALWSTPLVKPVTAAYAETSPETLFECDGMPLRLRWQYVPSNCEEPETGDNVPSNVYCDDLSGCASTAEITITGGNQGRSLTKNVAPHGYFDVTGLHSNDRVGPENTYRVEACDLVQEFTIHTSCSNDLEIGFQFYSLKLVGIFND